VTAEGYLEVAPTLGVDNRKLGVWVFLASEVIFFSALIATFLAFQVRSNIDASNVLNLPLTSVNTFILIVSSFTVVNALDAVQQGKHGLFRLMLLFTLVLGALFVGIQGREWAELIHKGVTPSNDIFGTAFFVLTGFHGLHVIVGLIWLLFVIARALRGDFSAGNNLGVETFGLYWHFVDIVWIVLFAIIYLI
jgi:heme/copper-type cytochrome/quinol oxidase subunit 3